MEDEKRQEPDEAYEPPTVEDLATDNEASTAAGATMADTAVGAE